MDYGFHAPTVSFPVPGTLMVEPTESEPKEELDRFCDAMLAIRAEIHAIVDGRADRDATTRSRMRRTRPRTSRPTSGRTRTPASRRRSRCRVCASTKFWPPVSRIDNPFGDRNLMCVCPPIDAYDEQPCVSDESRALSATRVRAGILTLALGCRRCRRLPAPRR